MVNAEKKQSIKTLLCQWLAKETRGFIGGVVGGLIGGLIAFSYVSYNVHPAAFSAHATAASVNSAVSTANSISGSDAISIANTYIVYTTFVIAAVALLLTIAGLIFTQHFAVEKEAHIANAFSSVLDVVRSDDEKAVKLVQQAMENPSVVEHVSDTLSRKIEQEIDAWKAGASARARVAAQEAEAVGAMFNDLSASKNAPKDSK